MLGFGIGEIILVLIVGIIILGPDKLPNAIVEVVKTIRVLKKTISDAKETLDREVNLAEIKKEALEYKEKLENDFNKIQDDFQVVKDAERGLQDNIQSVQNLFEDYKPKIIQEEKLSVDLNNSESFAKIQDDDIDKQTIGSIKSSKDES
ncbi:twin-arginine translocase subunit TatB [Helicobacter muridarum]|uniref:Sec-independent protein translocase protein TatB homolog n=1 Tax=Helicobacter muridarum TaxID=216 RepID=A0A377PVM5_9HELI|nr:Sec-independent protein translocase protein TatB [Helicobacter muridarum]TLE00919.1 twin-arginine translocase subunit TatB [Helicobacter muridarum]STQ86695.1 putative twin-arginine translocation protein [Helicobacter muridarum]